jgi:hypothetical protein
VIPAILELDHQSPIARKARRPPGEHAAWAADFADFETAADPLVVTLAPDELVAVRLLARARGTSYRWVLTLHVLEAGVRRMEELDLGEPFLTVAPRADDHAYLLSWFSQPNRIESMDAQTGLPMAYDEKPRLLRKVSRFLGRKN